MIKHLNALSDIHYQREVWVKHQPYPGIQYDELDYAVHFIFDNTCLGDNPLVAIGWFLKDEREAELIKGLVTALETVFDKYGMGLDDATYIEMPEWLNVLQAASAAKRVISLDI